MRNVVRALGLIANAAVPTRYLGIYTYTVVSSSEGKIDCVPKHDLTMPDLSEVPILGSTIGAVVTAKEGAECLVMFADGSSSRPRCVHVEESEKFYVDSDIDLGSSSGSSLVKGPLFLASIQAAVASANAGVGPVTWTVLAQIFQAIEQGIVLTSKLRAK